MSRKFVAAVEDKNVHVDICTVSNGVEIHVGNWAVGLISNNGTLRLFNGIEEDNEEGIMVDTDGNIVVET